MVELKLMKIGLKKGKLYRYIVYSFFFCKKLSLMDVLGMIRVSDHADLEVL